MGAAIALVFLCFLVILIILIILIILFILFFDIFFHIFFCGHWVPVSIGINHTRGDTPGEEGRQDTHRAAQALWANGFIADIRPISADMHGAFIADIRVQIGLRSEIPVIGPI